MPDRIHLQTPEIESWQIISGVTLAQALSWLGIDAETAAPITAVAVVHAPDVKGRVRYYVTECERPYQHDAHYCPYEWYLASTWTELRENTTHA